jgi:hypothetical protein
MKKRSLQTIGRDLAAISPGNRHEILARVPQGELSAIVAPSNTQGSAAREARSL